MSDYCKSYVLCVLAKKCELFFTFFKDVGWAYLSYYVVCSMEESMVMDRHPGQASRSAIWSIPRVVSELVERGTMEDGLTDLVRSLERADRLFVVGTGSSYYAAQLGAYALRDAGCDAWALPAFEFVEYPRPLRARDLVLVVSHRGNKRYSVEALKRGFEAEIPTVLLTGRPTRYSGTPPQHLIFTVPQEVSSMHTVSMIAAAVMLDCMGCAVAELRQGTQKAYRNSLTTLGTLLDGALTCEAQVEQVAAAVAERRARCFFVGGGPAAVASSEAALKVKEGAYLTAEGIDVESMLHGPMMSVEAADCAVVVAPEGPSFGRACDVVRALREFGTAVWWLSDHEPPVGVDWMTVLPTTLERHWIFSAIVVLDLFAWHLALACHTDPDGFRLEHEQYRRGYQTIVL